MFFEKFIGKVLGENYMKRLLKIVGALLALTFLFAACSENVDSGSSSSEGRLSSRAEPETVSVTLHLLYADTSKPWKVWAWKYNGIGDYNGENPKWPGTANMTKDGDKFTYTFSVSTGDDLGFLFVATGDADKTGDVVIPKAKLTANANFYCVYGVTDYYESEADCSGFKGVKVADKAGNSLSLQLFGAAAATKENFTVKDKDNAALTISTAKVTNTSATLTLTDGSIDKMPYSVTYTPTSGTPTTLTAYPEMAVFANTVDKDYFDNDATKADAITGLGVTISSSTATFKTWAPLASKVQVLLFTTAEAAGKKGESYKYQDWAPSKTPTEPGSGDIIDMTKVLNGDKWEGVWKADNVNISGKTYYKYRITNGGITRDVADIWHTVAGPDSVASQLISIDDASAKPTSWEASYTNPFGNSGTDTKKYSDAVIYEMHIRDWSGSANYDAGGSFEDFASDANIAHLKDLGVTHVQILPMFDYAQTNADTKYNWGYNPWHYNVPEGRYTKSMENGVDSVKQMRAMIKKLHDNDIAVIMDVVYNHTSGAGVDYSLYDMTVPKYFYVVDDEGKYSNGSGCGNNTDARKLMVQKYIVESLKHWMLDYHINGFRFDLMAVHSKTLMKKIYDALYTIDKNVLVYGEPWNGGSTGIPGTEETKGAGAGTTGPGWGAFDDDFRDGIKGSEFGGFGRGIVTGNENEQRVLTGLLGKPGANNRNETGKPQLTISYCECHDNYTLFDKILYSMNPDIKDKDLENHDCYTTYFKPLKDNLATYVDKIKKRERMAAAFVMLAQGTPFLDGGQEFLRSKNGNPDSYAADKKGGHDWKEADIKTCNLVDLSLKGTYFDVYDTYRGLIAFRQANLADFSGLDSGVAATAVEPNFIKYTTPHYVVYFNCTDSAQNITSDNTGKVVSVPGPQFSGFGGLGGHNISVVSKKYTVSSKSTTIAKVAPWDFLILKK